MIKIYNSLINRSAVYEKLGKIKLALTDLYHAKIIDPTRSSAYNNLVDLLILHQRSN